MPAGKGQPFEVSVSLDNMRQQAQKIAREDYGMDDPRQLDAFQHVYVSAKLADSIGKGAARLFGDARERLEGINRPDSQADVVNNDIGLRVRQEADLYVAVQRKRNPELTDEEAGELREKFLRDRSWGSVLMGESIPYPTTPDQEAEAKQRYDEEMKKRKGEVFASPYAKGDW
ncbi:MAG: hypothetical protein GC129_02560 [Proteobacteria bacterium]|nr:hypothetical protein [Pseudomonadota bacterium]